MSTPAEHLIASETSAERRFYPRIEPSTLISVPFGEDNAGMLLNVSENGLLVSTPVGLGVNFVRRVSLALNGLARPIEVYVRVVWTADSNRAGIQMLDLCDHDREQIRWWAAAQGERGKAAEELGILERENRAPESIANIGKGNGKRRTVRLSVTLGALAVVFALAMGLALWGTPLRAWLARSVKAGTKDAKPMQPISMPSNRRDDTQKQGVGLPGEAPSTTGSAATSGATGGKGDEAEKSATPMKLVGAPPASGNLGEKKLAVKKSANSYLGRPAELRSAVHNDLTASSAGDSGAEHATSDGLRQAGSGVESRANESASNATVEGGNVKKASEAPADGIVAGNTKADSPRSNHAAPNSPTEGSATPFDPKPDDSGAAANAVSSDRAPFAPKSSPVIETEAPKTRAIEVTLPNSDKASFFNVPGEQLIQSHMVTLHIQRSILAPARRRSWHEDQKKKVLVGELRSRVDPRPARAVEEAGVGVSVRAVLGKDGSVEQLMPVNGSAELVPSVVRAVRQWQFEPTLLDGKPVETAALILVEFHSPASGAARP